MPEADQRWPITRSGSGIILTDPNPVDLSNSWSRPRFLRGPVFFEMILFSRSNSSGGGVSYGVRWKGCGNDEPHAGRIQSPRNRNRGERHEEGNHEESTSEIGQDCVGVCVVGSVSDLFWLRE